MARSRIVDAPATTDVYFGMVLCSFLAIAVSVALLVLELSGSYGFESSPPPLASPNLPKVPVRELPKAEGNAIAPATDKPIAALNPTHTPAPTESKPAVASNPEPIPATIPATVTNPGPVPSNLSLTPKPLPLTPTTQVPAPTSSGPVPGFELPKKK